MCLNYEVILLLSPLILLYVRVQVVVPSNGYKFTCFLKIFLLSTFRGIACQFAREETLLSSSSFKDHTSQPCQ